MMLTPREIEKLAIYVVADVARRRKNRGLKLNVPEATALIVEALLDGARDGRTVSELMELGKSGCKPGRRRRSASVARVVVRPGEARPSRTRAAYRE